MNTDLSTPPTLGTHYIRFQHELAASEHITTLANLLAHAHFLYEGWPKLADLPLAGDLKRIYSNAATFAVRWCSTVDQKVARAKAERWALDNIFRLRQDQLNAHSHEEADQILRDFVGGILDEHRFTLMHGPRQLSVRDQLRVAEIEAPDDPRRI